MSYILCFYGIAMCLFFFVLCFYKLLRPLIALIKPWPVGGGFI